MLPPSPRWRCSSPNERVRARGQISRDRDLRPRPTTGGRAGAARGAWGPRPAADRTARPRQLQPLTRRATAALAVSSTRFLSFLILLLRYLSTAFIC